MRQRAPARLVDLQVAFAVTVLALYAWSGCDQPKSGTRPQTAGAGPEAGQVRAWSTANVRSQDAEELRLRHLAALVDGLEQLEASSAVKRSEASSLHWTMVLADLDMRGETVHKPLSGPGQAVPPPPAPGPTGPDARYFTLRTMKEWRGYYAAKSRYPLVWDLAMPADMTDPPISGAQRQQLLLECRRTIEALEN